MCCISTKSFCLSLDPVGSFCAAFSLQDRSSGGPTFFNVQLYSNCTCLFESLIFKHTGQGEVSGTKEKVYCSRQDEKEQLDGASVAHPIEREPLTKAESLLFLMKTNKITESRLEKKLLNEMKMKMTLYKKKQ